MHNTATGTLKCLTDFYPGYFSLTHHFQGLDKIVFLPFGYLLDLFRYAVFRGFTTPRDYNCHFWQLREALQGVEPPVPRTEDDFDPAAKYHISADVEYMRLVNFESYNC